MTILLASSILLSVPRLAGYAPTDLDLRSDNHLRRIARRTFPSQVA